MPDSLERPHLTWVRGFTEPDTAGRSSEQYTAQDPAHPGMLARICQLVISNGLWTWHVGERVIVGNGTAETATEAAVAAEAAWNTYRERERDTPTG